MLEWNVFYRDVNAQKIIAFNIFDHYNFNKDVQRNLKQLSNKTEFEKALKSDLQYYFWSKAEYEVVISPWCGGKNTSDIKVDIYTQVMNNWDVFVDYVWNSRADIIEPHINNECHTYLVLYIGHDRSAKIATDTFVSCSTGAQLAEDAKAYLSDKLGYNNIAVWNICKLD